jgi:hypothetical protein
MTMRLLSLSIVQANSSMRRACSDACASAASSSRTVWLGGWGWTGVWLWGVGVGVDGMGVD